MTHFTSRLTIKFKQLLLCFFIIVLTSCGGGGDNSGAEVNTVTPPSVTSDTVAPIITLNGEEAINVKQFEAYNELGATASDNVDSSVDVIIEGTVDTDTLGEYIITYTATDNADNQATKTRTVNVVSTVIIQGKAAAGSALIGKVYVKGSNNMTVSSSIDIDGSFEVDVSNLAAPYRLRAKGRAGSKLYNLFSYTQNSNINSVVNITPFTDLIIANVTQETANNFFFSNSNTNLNTETLQHQESALQAKLQSLLDALGVSADIDLITSNFDINNQGLHAALDIVDISIHEVTNIATITNRLDNSSITDDIRQSDDNTEVLNVNSEQVTQVVTEHIAVAELFDNFSSAINIETPTFTDIATFFNDDFLSNEQTKTSFINQTLSDVDSKMKSIVSLAIDNINIATGRASVIFSYELNDIIDVEYEQWFVTKDETLGWQFSGDEKIVKLVDKTFQCEQSNDINGSQESCGLNASFQDVSLDNNGTDGAAILSAKVDIFVTGYEDDLPRDTFYLGMPENSTYAKVYHEGQQQYISALRPFGSDLGQIQPISFHSGDILQYTLYKDNLDLTDPESPSVEGHNIVATYSRPIIYAPNSDDNLITFRGRYPEYSQASKDSINNFILDNDLVLEWTLLEDTYSHKVIVEIINVQGELVTTLTEELNSSTISNSTFDAIRFTEALANHNDFDPANGYSILVKVVAKDIRTGQIYATNYTSAVN